MSNNSKSCASDVIEYQEYSMIKQILEEKGYAEASPSRINHVKEKFSLITRIGGIRNKKYKSTWFFKKGPEYSCLLQIVTSGPKNRRKDFISSFIFGHNRIENSDSFTRTIASRKSFFAWLSKTDALLSKEYLCPGCRAIMHISKGVLICNNIRRHEQEKSILVNPVDGQISFYKQPSKQAFRKKQRSFVIK